MGAVVCGRKREPNWCTLRRVGGRASPMEGVGPVLSGRTTGGVSGRGLPLLKCVSMCSLNGGEDPSASVTPDELPPCGPLGSCSIGGCSGCPDCEDLTVSR